MLVDLTERDEDRGIREPPLHRHGREPRAQLGGDLAEGGFPLPSWTPWQHQATARQHDALSEALELPRHGHRRGLTIAPD
jgi:hypothetical protein